MVSRRSLPVGKRSARRLLGNVVTEYRGLDDEGAERADASNAWRGVHFPRLRKERDPRPDLPPSATVDHVAVPSPRNRNSIGGVEPAPLARRLLGVENLHSGKIRRPPHDDPLCHDLPLPATGLSFQRASPSEPVNHTRTRRPVHMAASIASESAIGHTARDRWRCRYVRRTNSKRNTLIQKNWPATPLGSRSLTSSHP